MIAVVGAGECGTRAAFALREHGYAGPITLLGAEDGLPYERPPLSKTWSVTPICDADRLRDNGIDYRSGVAATALDPVAHTVEVDGAPLAYDRLLLATGARARPLGDALVLRTAQDAAALRGRLGPGVRVGVVGGGLIGLEVAASAAGLGCAVSVVEAAPRLLARGVPAPVAARIEARHRAAGTALHLGVGVAERVGDGLRLTDGTIVAVDVVVAGIGGRPETALAEAAGLAVADGVVVDSRFRTSAADVFAAGDCATGPHGRTESWRAAQEQGAAAARALLDLDPGPAAVPWFWSDQFELSLQVAGSPGAAAREVVRTRTDGVEIWFGLAGDGRLVAAAGVGPGTAVAKDVRVAELLMARGAAPAEADLKDPGVRLRQLLS